MDIPQIYINYDSLKEKKQLIADTYYQTYNDDTFTDEERYEYELYKDLHNVLENRNAIYDVVIFPTFSFIRISPEFSSEFRVIQTILNELYVEYRTAIN